MRARAIQLGEQEEMGTPQLEEQRVVLHGQTWADYERLCAGRGEGSVPRVTFLEGDIELMSPGILHEDDKTKLARIIEAWADETGQFLDGFGSWTLKNERADRGSEPDECYVLTEKPRSRIRRPDLAIEVVRTSGGISKLEVYRKLGVREVWFWADGRLRFYALRRGLRYAELDRSELLPSLDPSLVARAMRESSQPAAVRVLRAAMRKRKRKR